MAYPRRANASGLVFGGDPQDAPEVVQKPEPPHVECGCPCREPYWPSIVMQTFTVLLLIVMVCLYAMHVNSCST